MKKKAYPIVWRWHLFAGIIIAPFLIFLAVTGALYLFKADIEEYIYKDYYYVEDGGDKLPVCPQKAALETSGPGPDP